MTWGNSLILTEGAYRDNQREQRKLQSEIEAMERAAAALKGLPVTLQVLGELHAAEGLENGSVLHMLLPCLDLTALETALLALAEAIEIPVGDVLAIRIRVGDQEASSGIVRTGRHYAMAKDPATVRLEIRSTIQRVIRQAKRVGVVNPDIAAPAWQAAIGSE